MSLSPCLMKNFKYFPHNRDSANRVKNAMSPTPSSSRYRIRASNPLNNLAREMQQRNAYRANGGWICKIPLSFRREQCEPTSPSSVLTSASASANRVQLKYAAALVRPVKTNLGNAALCIALECEFMTRSEVDKRRSDKFNGSRRRIRPRKRALRTFQATSRFFLAS